MAQLLDLTRKKKKKKAKSTASGDEKNLRPRPRDGRRGRLPFPDIPARRDRLRRDPRRLPPRPARPQRLSHYTELLDRALDPIIANNPDRRSMKPP